MDKPIPIFFPKLKKINKKIIGHLVVSVLIFSTIQKILLRIQQKLTSDRFLDDKIITARLQEIYSGLQHLPQKLNF